MFVILLKYTQPVSEIDKFLDEHRIFLEKNYANGTFLMSGRKVPRTGGVILAVAESREKIEAVLKEDPFYRAEVCEYEIVEFVPSMTCDSLSEFRVDIS